jgi:hypothetical protein
MSPSRERRRLIGMGLWGDGVLSRNQDLIVLFPHWNKYHIDEFTPQLNERESFCFGSRDRD